MVGVKGRSGTHPNSKKKAKEWGLQNRSPERRRQIQSMGGKATNKNGRLSLSQKIVWLKKKGVTDERAQELYNFMVDGEYSKLDIMKSLMKLRDSAQDSKEELAIIDRMMGWHKMHHGDVKKIDMNLSVNLNEPLKQETIDAIFEFVDDDES